MKVLSFNGQSEFSGHLGRVIFSVFFSWKSIQISYVNVYDLSTWLDKLSAHSNSQSEISARTDDWFNVQK